MAVIWGLDLRDMQWGKFKSSYMWNTQYHLRRTKFIVYQCAMIFCVISESVGTAALSNYVDQQDFVSRLTDNALIYNDDFIGIASYNIFTGIYVATIFGAAFFFDLFWPERHESPAVKFAWKVCAILACVFTLADALALTVIVATRSAYITGAGAARATELLTHSEMRYPLVYRHNTKAITSVVFLWVGLLGVLGSTVVLFTYAKHEATFGPKSTHLRKEEGRDSFDTEENVGMGERGRNMEEAMPARVQAPERATVAEPRVPMEEVAR